MPEQQVCRTTADNGVGESRHSYSKQQIDDLDYFQVQGDEYRRARNTDPETSHAAAAKAAKFAASHAGRIHAALKANGPRTAQELSALVGLSVVQIDRRLPEAQRAGLVELVLLSDGGLKVIDGFRLWRAL